MAGKTLDLKSIIIKDQLGDRITHYWLDWDMRREKKKAEWREVRNYVYATDTTTTTNAILPWKNKTTVPKLCQIRDNLYANYMASLFPKRKWLIWEGSDEESEDRGKREAIQNYACWMVSQPQFKTEVSKLILDYIDYGNLFVGVDWVDRTVQLDDKTQVGYVGPIPVRYSPVDTVMNPVAPSFTESPKIFRSLVSLGEVKEMITRFSKPDTQEAYDELWTYLKRTRQAALQGTSSNVDKDEAYRMDGFTSFTNYLQSDYCEILTFYGDIYDIDGDQFLRNHVVMVADRHKVIYKGPNPSFFGTAPVWHCGWRPRQDNLWAMGPLDNLVGMQYRLDHIENLKADVFDLITFPPLKIKGTMDDFQWRPLEKIYVGDDGDVEMVAPPFQVLTANQEIEYLTRMMEEMAGSPKEAMGIRSPGEKTAYEVQRLENAASRIFQNKIMQFEEQVLEPLLNGMLELARRKMTSTSIRVFDDELKFASFQKLTAQDVTGNGRLRPMAARHFAERAERIQNLNNFYQSAVGMDPEIKAHWSTIKTAKLFEEDLDIAEYEIVMPFVRVAEQQEAKRLAAASQQQLMMEIGTPAGIAEDDYDEDMSGGIPEQSVPGMDQPPQGPQAPGGVLPGGSALDASAQSTPPDLGGMGDLFSQ